MKNGHLFFRSPGALCKFPNDSENKILSKNLYQHWSFAEIFGQPVHDIQFSSVFAYKKAVETVERTCTLFKNWYFSRKKLRTWSYANILDLFETSRESLTGYDV